MVKISAIIVFVVIVCVASVGFVLFYNPHPSVEISEIEIDEEPVPLGAEMIYNADLELLSQGQGAIEVTPYKTQYIQGESVKFTAHPLEGWRFDHWEGELAEELSLSDTISLRMPDGTFKIIAVFVQE